LIHSFQIGTEVEIAIMASLPAKRNVDVYARQCEFYYFANITNPHQSFEKPHLGLLPAHSSWGNAVSRSKWILVELEE
tara:strand:+ start:21126 stop:21359 length:234 start_codon:yes stop_codon:yes gene_type:complete